VPPFATGKAPVTPVVSGNPVHEVRVPDVGVPRIGVTSVGVFANTFAPVPVSSVRTAARFALDGVAKNVATFAAKPDTPDAMGKPVQLVNVPDAGVPRIGVTITMLVLVQALMLPLVTVPSTGVTKVGLVNNSVLVSCLVVPLCTMGITSAGFMTAATGSAEMAMVVIMAPRNFH
jgi:hypothetical protein